MWKFKEYIGNSTQNILPIHWRMQFLYKAQSSKILKRPTPTSIRTIELFWTQNMRIREITLSDSVRCYLSVIRERVLFKLTMSQSSKEIISALVQIIISWVLRKWSILILSCFTQDNIILGVLIHTSLHQVQSNQFVKNHSMLVRW